MVFKRRDRRPLWRIVVEALWPRGGWGRAATYVKHRLRRLPDTPEKISRGIAAGVFVTFSPFYGLHFLISAALAWIMRGNILAALLATFFGNPLTYLPIIATSMFTGYWLLGLDPRKLRFRDHESGDAPTILERFVEASESLWANFKAMFTPDQADWHSLRLFYDEVFFPFVVGGLIPGVIAGLIAYYTCLPLIAAYQKRRKKELRAKLAKLGKGTAEATDR